MRLSVLLAVPAVLAAPATKRAQPAPLHVPRGSDTKLIPNKYIVKFNENIAGASAASAMSLLPKEADHVFDNVFKGFAGHLDDKALKAMRDHPHVEYIEQDSISSASGYVVQENAPWGLARISHRAAGSSDYVYHNSGGLGTCVYVVDSGVDHTHQEFEGRAISVASFIPGHDQDEQGHGTHVAGIIGSKTFGVAKRTHIYSIKVLDSEGNGPNSGIIAGMDHVSRDAANRSCPNGIVVNLSISGDFSQAMNNAAASLGRKGYFVAVAAGNSNVDALGVSPASEPSACTIGATDEHDVRYELSNHGISIDVMAPGVHVYSTYPHGRYGYSTGTSMAAPHVAGLAAYLATLENHRAGPHLCQRIQQLSTRGSIKKQTASTHNILAFNGNPSG